ncbi:MAG: TolC family protein [Spirochaetes bacterium]|nr:TolC family protein [Spirochaetota bacterium]MBU0955531.1 TolC family protein [Spirochaetota bacterium]
MKTAVRHSRLPALGLGLILWLGATMQLTSQTAATQTMAIRIIDVQQIMDSAANGADKVLTAQEAVDDAAEALRETAFWYNLQLKLNGSYRGSLQQTDSGGAAPGQDPLTGSLSLSAPLPFKASLSASIDLEGKYSASASWSPLGKDSSRADAELKLQLAAINLQDARKQASLEAAAALTAVLSAEASLRSAQLALEAASIEVQGLETLQLRGESDRLSLLQAQAQYTKAAANLAKAQLTASQARENLAQKTGADLADLILAGAELEVGLAELGDDWQPPVYDALRWNKTVAEKTAQVANLEQAPWFSGNGPLSLQASLDSSGSFSISGSIALDWALISGKSFLQRNEALSEARQAKSDATESARAAYEAAVVEVELAGYNLSIASAELEYASIDHERADIQLARGEISPTAYAQKVDNLSKARLTMELASLDLLRARLVLE